MHKRILLISYYWPPAGGAGVQRWLKMNKYFHESGIQLWVYTAKPKNYVAEDPSLIEDIHSSTRIIRRPIWEPYSLYSKLTGQKSKQNNYSGFIREKKAKGILHQLGLIVRSNLFIPDARCFWIKPSSRYLLKWLKTHDVDAIISTGPPHSMHLIALNIKNKRNKIPWIADFRDPWTNIDFYRELKMIKWADKRHHLLEKKVLQTADKVVTVSWNWKNEMEKISDRTDVELVFNGFDPADFVSETKNGGNRFSMCHVGSMDKRRNPLALWQAVSNLLRDAEFAANVQIRLIGPVDYQVFETIRHCGLDKIVEHVEFLPHDRAIAEMKNSKLLLLPINESDNKMGRIPIKLYEYLASKKPILAIGEGQADFARILGSFEHCDILGNRDVAGIQKAIRKQFDHFTAGPPQIRSNQNLDRFSRRQLAKEYAEIIHRLT